MRRESQQLVGSSDGDGYQRQLSLTNRTSLRVTSRDFGASLFQHRFNRHRNTSLPFACIGRFHKGHDLERLGGRVQSLRSLRHPHIHVLFTVGRGHLKATFLNCLNSTSTRSWPRSKDRHGSNSGTVCAEDGSTRYLPFICCYLVTCVSIPCCTLRRPALATPSLLKSNFLSLADEPVPGGSLRKRMNPAFYERPGSILPVGCCLFSMPSN